MVIRYRECERCGFTFPAKNVRARFCSSSCRAAAHYARKSEAALLEPDPGVPAPKAAPSALQGLEGVVALDDLARLVAQHLTGAATTEPAAEQDDDATAPATEEQAPAPRATTWGPTETATRARLAAAGRTETYLGQSAIALAFRIDNSQGETLSALASGTKALQERMSAALGAASPAASASPTPGGQPDDAHDGTVAPVDPLEAARARREARRFASK